MGRREQREARRRSAANPDDRKAAARATEPATLIDLPPARAARPEDVASIIAANLAPVAAMLFFGQSAAEILFLFAVDTALAILMIVWLVVEHVTEAKSALTGAKRALAHAFGALVASAFLNAFLVGPIVFIALSKHVASDVDFASPGFRSALAMQVIGSGWALWRTHRALQGRDDDDAYLSSRFKFVVARVFVLLFVLFSGFAFVFGAKVGAILLVLIYCGAGIGFGLFPDLAHRLFHPRTRGGTA